MQMYRPAFLFAYTETKPACCCRRALPFQMDEIYGIERNQITSISPFQKP